MKVSTILDFIDMGSIALPEFQRGYVWNRDQVKGLMYSLYRRHPVGGLLVWATSAEIATTRGDQPAAHGVIKLLLDGQQRVTTLYGIIRGKPPKFFDGNAQAFTGLYFNLEDEVFEFYAPAKMKDNPLWIDVTQLMLQGLAAFYPKIASNPTLNHKAEIYFNRANAITSIQEIDLHIEEVTGSDKSIDIVVDIFNRVNSGGTKLSKGDLALAKICASWPNARDEMKDALNKWRNVGYDFKLDWLLRNMTTIATGKPMYSDLADCSVQEWKSALINTINYCNTLLNAISMRLGLDHDRVLGARYSFPVMARYLSLHKGSFSSAAERDKMLFWYIHCFLWGRYATSVESVMAQDLNIVNGNSSDIDRLIEQLDRWRGTLTIRPDDFSGTSIGSRFYPLLYLLTRICGAKDWGNGLPLTAHLLGKSNNLQVHHIFPKALLYQHNISRYDVNAVANYCFLTQGTNLNISAKKPEDYFLQIEDKFPGALQSQWIPMDSKLWKVENYHDFLAERRALLASAANGFLHQLQAGTAPSQLMNVDQIRAPQIVVNDEDKAINELILWIADKDLPMPERDFEILDSNTEAPLLSVALAWPEGIQVGLSKPLVALIEIDPVEEALLSRLGYQVIVGVESIKQYLCNYLAA